MSYRPKYKFMFQVLGRFINPCILVYAYNSTWNHYHYGKDAGDELIKFELPRHINNNTVGSICHQCQILSDEGKSFDDIQEYIKLRIEYFNL